MGYPTLQIPSNDISKASNLQSPFESQDFPCGYNPTMPIYDVVLKRWERWTSPWREVCWCLVQQIILPKLTLWMDISPTVQPRVRQETAEGGEVEVRTKWGPNIIGSREQHMCLCVCVCVWMDGWMHMSSNSLFHLDTEHLQAWAPGQLGGGTGVPPLNTGHAGWAVIWETTCGIVVQTFTVWWWKTDGDSQWFLPTPNHTHAHVQKQTGHLNTRTF